MKKLFVLFILVFSFSCKKQVEKRIEISRNQFSDSLQNNDALQIHDSAQIKRSLQDQQDWELQNKEVERIEKEGRKNFVFNLSKDSFSFKLFCKENGDNGIVDFTKIEVFKNGRFIQKIVVDSAFVYKKSEIDFRIADDVNFDGYKDLQLPNWVGMHDVTYHYYIYNPTAEKFIFNKSLSKIRNPVFDEKNKVIKSGFHDGPGPNNFLVYIWEKGEVILDNGFYIDPAHGKEQHFERKNGKITFK